MAATTKKPINKKLQKVLDHFPLFCKNFVKIIDNNNDLIPFVLNDAQLDIHEMSKTNRFIAISKSRQAGISTMSCADSIYRAVTKPNQNILIVSYAEQSATALFNMAKSMNNNLPRDKYKDLFPEIVRDNRNELIFSNGSKITSATSGFKDIGRGNTYSKIHLSELAFFGNAEVQLLSAENALAKSSGSNLTIETTSKGLNFWHGLYTKAEKSQSKYKPYFLPFYHKLYAKQFQHDHNEAMAWYQATHGKKLSVKDLEDDEKVLYEKGCNLRFLTWRRFKLLDMTEEGFKQEYPSTAMESFISTGNSVFDPAKVLEQYHNIMPPLSRKELINEIPQELHKFIGKGLEIYHLPKHGKRYMGGCDTASGSGQDHSTITIYDSDGEEVLSFNNNKTPVYEFAEVVTIIGHYYNYAYLAIERNSYGLSVIEKCRKDHGYLNLHKQKVFNDGKKKLQLGIQTTAVTKPILLTDFKQQFECGLIQINCKETLNQMQIYVETDGSMNNKRGKNNFDDLIISNAMAIAAMKSNKTYV